MTTTVPEWIAPIRNPGQPTQEDFALIGEHILVYSGEVHLAWENSTATSGRLIHGPLLMATRPSWRVASQVRDYVVTKNAAEVGGRDVLNLYYRNETSDTFASLYWARAPPT